MAMIERPARWRGVAAALILAGAFGALSSIVCAEDEGSHERFSEHDHDRAERARERGEVRPLEEIMPILRQRSPGEVAQIELEREHGVWIYEFKVINPAGRLLKIRIDAATGRVVAAEGEGD
jgi:uncharacterized membrane protein YkoI